MKALTLAALTTLTLLSVPLANAQTSSEEFTELLMEVASDDIEEMGFNPVGNDLTGSLGDMEYYNHTRYFVEGKPYLVSAVCDEDCEDIDIAIYDEDDKEVAADEDESDYALTGFVPKDSGYYKVEVWMYDCDASYCYYRVRTFD